MINPDISTNRKLIVANYSGFFGDRFSAAKEMVQGGPIDFLTGDYLAELTMAILFGKKMKNPDHGYVGVFLKQMKEIMKECLEKKIRIVSNAGGLNPKGLAAALTNIAEELGLSPVVACIEGDDLMDRFDTLQEKGETFSHLDFKTDLKDQKSIPVSANAYLGCWGIVEALKNGADIVVGGRLADAALVAGPAAWKFGWKKDDWDKLASAYAAGHIIECGTQATGGNYSFIDEVPSFRNMGFPIAEINADGSFVITKHKNTGGLVSVGTVTAQLLYEIKEPQYLTPDVVSCFDTLKISATGKDRVSVSGVLGAPPPDSTKVCINLASGYRNSMTVILTGLDIEKKAAIVEEELFAAIGGKKVFDKVNLQLIRTDKDNPEINEEAFAYLRISVMDSDPVKVGKLFTSKVVELALANIPGFTLTTPPAKPMAAIKHWPTLISSKYITQKIYIGNKELIVKSVRCDRPFEMPEPTKMELPAIPPCKTISIALGRVFATRSGDKGGNANLGIWAKNGPAFAFLKSFLTVEKLKGLLPDLAQYPIDRYEMPNLFAVNFYINGILGDGIANSTRIDGQAKTLGEYLRMKIIEMPDSVIEKNVT